MHVYKLCWKMILHAWKSIVAFLVIFLSIVILVDYSNAAEYEEQNVKIPVLFINEDTDSVLSEQFQQFLSRYVTYPDIMVENESQLENHLFYEKVVCVIQVPENFTENYVGGSKLQIIRHHFIETEDTVLVEMLINQYLSVLQMYQERQLPLNEAVLQIEEELQKKVDVTYDISMNTKNIRFGLYANYLSYVLMSVIMLYTGRILLQFRKDQISKRNAIAPIQTCSIYKEAAFAAWVAGVIITVLLLAIGLIITRTYWKQPEILLICLNVILYSLFSVSLAFILGINIKSARALELIGQIIALGSSFLCGVFVKQDMLSTVITVFARLTPTYWFIRINNTLSLRSTVRFHEYQEFIIQDGIVLCYALVLFVISFIIAEKKVKIELRA